MSFFKLKAQSSFFLEVVSSLFFIKMKQGWVGGWVGFLSSQVYCFTKYYIQYCNHRFSAMFYTTSKLTRNSTRTINVCHSSRYPTIFAFKSKFSTKGWHKDIKSSLIMLWYIPWNPISISYGDYAQKIVQHMTILFSIIIFITK